MRKLQLHLPKPAPHPQADHLSRYEIRDGKLVKVSEFDLR